MKNSVNSFNDLVSLVLNNRLSFVTAVIIDKTQVGLLVSVIIYHFWQIANTVHSIRFVCVAWRG